MRIATFNLYHFAEPGIYWHERKEKNTYTGEEWAAKTGFVRAKLREMAADVVGFQEVVSVDALKDLCREEGYPHFAHGGSVRFDKDDEGVYVNAVVALASRHPFLTAADVGDTADIANETYLDDRFAFSRTPLRAEIDLPGIGVAPVYVCHFKSQGAFVSDEVIDSISDWQEKLRVFFAERMHAGVDQVSRRGGEAGAMYRHLMADIAGDLNRPAILIGDLNEGPQSHTLGILTQEDRFFHLGSLGAHEIPASARRFKYSFRLYDAYTALPPQTQSRPITHKGYGDGSVLDYVILTNGLNARNPARAGEVTRVKVHDSHFMGRFDKRETSDHAPVSVDLSAPVRGDGG